MSIVSMQAFAYISMWGIYSSLVSSSGLLPPSSLSSAIPRVFLMNLCRSMLLRHPVGFDGYLAGISLPICTLFSFVNIGAGMLRIPLCLIEHVGVLQKSARAQFVCFLCMFRQCKMRRRPDVHRLRIVAIFANIESVENNRNLLL